MIESQAGAAAPERDAGRAAVALEGHRRVLQLLARGATVTDCLSALCAVIEERAPGAISSILLMDAEGKHLSHGAGPHLPAAFRALIDGKPIGPTAGSCGTATYLAREVIVEDIRTDPLWAEYRGVALQHELLACASVPIIDRGGRVLGSFAIYHRTAGPFSPQDLAVLREMTGLATVVIEHDLRRAALIESEARFRLIAEKTGQVIFDVNLTNGKAVWAGAMETTFGEFVLPGPGMEGLVDRVHADDRARVRAALGNLRPGAGPVRLDYQVRHRDGRYRTVNHHGGALFDEQGAVTRHYGTLADVTEQRATEEALRERQKLDSLGLLAGGIAHDFNNLLAALLGNVNLLTSEPGMPVGSVPHLESLQSTILRASDLTRQLLAYSGRARFVVRPVDLSSVVEAMTTLLSVTVPKKVRLQTQLGADLPAVEADVAQLQQVVMNLVTNAAEAIGDGTGTVDISTGVLMLEGAAIAATPTLHDLSPGRYVQLTVHDDGSGMTPEIAARIFDPFFSTKKLGHGLGLSAMLGILRAHRGGIVVQTALGRGSTFQVMFPVSSRPVEKVVPPSPGIKVAHVRSRGLVLIVDDEPAILRASALQMKRLGFEVQTASDGREAVDKILGAPGAFSLVVMDLTMPRMSGREALSEIRRREPDLPVVICSGYGEDAYAGDDAATGFLQKPYQAHEFQRLIDTLLARRPT